MLKSELNKKRPSLFLLGVIAACSMTLTAFSWQFERDDLTIYIPLEDESLLIEVDMAQVFIEREKMAFSPAQPEVKKKSTSIIASDKPKEMSLTKLDNRPSSIKPLKRMDTQDKVAQTLATASSPSSVSYRSLKIHEMPYLRSCGHLKDDVERFQCTQSEMRRHIATNFKVPPVDVVPDIPAKVFVTFIIDEYGSIDEVIPSEKINPVLLEEVIKVFTSMPEMVPAVSAGRKLAVRFEIPLAIQRLR
jgi:hypothetical protein